MNKSFIRNFWLFVAVILMTSCSPNMYYWGNYNIGLYRYYKHPEDREKFIEHLTKIIEVAEPGGVVPPGIYAEYGYILFEDKKFAQSIEFFQKEYDMWEESRVLMGKMIRNAEKAKESYDANKKDVVEDSDAAK